MCRWCTLQKPAVCLWHGVRAKMNALIGPDLPDLETDFIQLSFTRFQTGYPLFRVLYFQVYYHCYTRRNFTVLSGPPVCGVVLPNVVMDA